MLVGKLSRQGWQVELYLQTSSVSPLVLVGMYAFTLVSRPVNLMFCDLGKNSVSFEQIMCFGNKTLTLSSLSQVSYHMGGKPE